MSDEVERRAHARKTIHTPACADPGGILPVIDCRIVDLSKDGAKLVAPPDADMPEIFHLQIDSSRMLGAAEVVWRGQNQVGVRFLFRA